MLLYIIFIYIEPLLMMRRTRGLTVSLVQQKDEDYCDDVNFVEEWVCDLIFFEKYLQGLRIFLVQSCPELRSLR
jgi:hypothetical protein